MTESDSDLSKRPPARGRSAVSGSAPILDLEASRIKHEGIPEGAQAAASDEPLHADSARDTSEGGQLPGERPETVAEAAHVDSAPSAAAARSAGEAAPGQREAPLTRGRKGIGLGGLLLASLLGGLIGAGLTAAGERWWRPYWPDPLEPRVAQIEQRTERPAAPNVPSDLDRRLSGLETAVRQASDRARAADERAAAAAARADEVIKSAPAQVTAASPPADTAVVDQLGTRIAALEEEVRKRGQDGGAVQAIETRLGDQDQRLGALSRQLADRLAADTRTGEVLERRLSDQERRAADQDGRLAALLQRSADQDERGTALTQRAAEQDKRVAEQESRLSDQDKRLAGVVEGLAAERRDEAAQRGGVTLSVTDHLAGEFRQGAPYAPTLEALRRLGVDQASLAPLEPFAADGAPKADALAKEFSSMADRVRSESRAASSGSTTESWEERLRRMAGALVTVRPLQDGPGAGPSGPVDPLSAVETALGQGDLARAAIAWDDLPESLRRSGEAFGTKLKQRAAADQAVRKLSGDALGAVGASAR